MRRLAGVLALCTLASCSAKHTHTSEQTQSPEPPPFVSPTQTTTTEQLSCATAACWRELATEATQAGHIDLASARLGEVFALEPTAQTLDAWLDDLLASGQIRAAHRAVDLAKDVVTERPQLAAHLEARRQSLPTWPKGHAIVSTRSPEVFAALARGDLQTAISLQTQFAQHRPGPQQLEHLGHLLDLGDQSLAANRARAQARIAADHSGAQMRLEVAEGWRTEAAAWVGQHLVLVRSFEARDYSLEIPASRVEFWRPGKPATLDFSYMVEGTSSKIALASDGNTLLRARGNTVVLHEAYSGEVVGQIKLSGRIGDFTGVGVGDQTKLLAITDRRVELRDARGQVLDAYTLKGTTPTITRVYRGPGSYHDNILKDVASWPVSLALTDEGSMVAIGGSDGKVRVINRTSKRRHVLAYTWKYEERRHHGANPDLNLPLEMRFVDNGRSLLVAYRHGDVITWDTQTGRKKNHLPGRCTVAEATTTVNKFNGPDTPMRTPSADQRIKCGYAKTARFAPDGSWMVTAGEGIRIRDLKTGASKAMIVRGDGSLIPDDMLEVSSDNTLALVNLYGRPELWRGGNELHKMLPGEAATGPISPRMSQHADRLEFELGRQFHAWNLHTGAPIEVDLKGFDEVAALSPNGELAVVSRSGTGELLDVPSKRVLRSWPNLGNMVSARFSPDGSHVVVDRGWEESRTISLYNTQTGREQTLDGTIDLLPRLSNGAKLLVSLERQQAVHVFDNAGQPVESFPAPEVRAAAVSHNGEFVVWVSGSDKPEATVTYMPVGRRGTPKTLAIKGWPKRECLAISPDDQEIFVCTEKTITRWRPQANDENTRERGYVTADRAYYTPTGKQLLLAGFGRIDIYQNNAEMSPLGALYPLLDGGWAAISVGGAVDGSDHAHAHMCTYTVGQSTWVTSGKLAWDRFYTPNLVRRMTAGEAVWPVIPALDPESIRTH